MFLDVLQVAERLSVSPGLVRRLVERGEIPHHRFGRLVKIDQADVDAYLAGSRRIGEAVSPARALQHLRPPAARRSPVTPLRHLRPPLGSHSSFPRGGNSAD